MGIVNKNLLIIIMIFFSSGCSIQYSIIRDDVDKIKEYISEGNDINTRENGHIGRSLLQIAIDNKRYTIAKLLVENGAIFSDSDFINATTKWDSAELIKLMLEKGANVNTRVGKSELTPLMCASINGHTDIIKLLLANGADINALTKDSISSWMLALHFSEIKAAQLLLGKGASMPFGKATIIIMPNIDVVGQVFPSPIQILGDASYYIVNPGPHIVSVSISGRSGTNLLGNKVIYYGSPIALTINAESNGIYVIESSVDLTLWTWQQDTWNAQFKKVWPLDVH